MLLDNRALLVLIFKLGLFKSNLLSRLAHRTTNFTNPEFQFPQFMLQSVFIFFLGVTKNKRFMPKF